MRSAIDFIAFLVAMILFILAAWGVTARKVNLMALGLAFFALPFLIAAWP